MDVVKDPSLKAELNKVPVGDGQQGWAAIKKKAEESTATKNASQHKMKYLSNVCIDDGSWRGTNKGFLDHWCNTCRVCEEYTSFTHFDDTLKLEMLKNVVKGAPCLASIETNLDLSQQMGHSMMPMDFDGYFEVLSSAAENYDDKVGSTVCANTRHASMHSTSYDTFNNDPDIFYDVDTEVDTIMANVHNRVLAYYSNGACIPDDAWSRLPQSSREAWQGIPTEDHKLIMGTGNFISNLTGTPSSSASSNGNGCGCRTFARTHDCRKVNFLNHSADDGTADTEPKNDTDDVDLIDNVLVQYNVNFATLCANVAKQKNSELIASGKHAHY
jgi:hypothetical protein